MCPNSFYCVDGKSWNASKKKKKKKTKKKHLISKIMLEFSEVSKKWLTRISCSGYHIRKEGCKLQCKFTESWQGRAGRLHIRESTEAGA